MTDTLFSDFQRYLTAKVSIDDRALNKDVAAALATALRPLKHRPLRVLEVGAGIATMAQRLWRWRLHPHILYTGVDVSPQNIAHARTRLRAWAREQKISVVSTDSVLILHAPDQQMAIMLEAADALAFVQRPQQAGQWDMLIAHAFLDLVDIPAALPRLLAALADDGLCWATLNFDGVTLFEPVVDAALEATLMQAYHHSMDERLIAGQLSGDSRAGRHLFGHFQRAGAEVIAAGASDWVVFPQQGGYPRDEAFFLHFIIHTVQQELAGRPETAGAQLDAWAAMRHEQIELGELLYIAHQLDYLARTR